MAPESLIVFELKEPLVTFIEAIRAIPGLEFIGEGKDDEEFAAGDEAGSDDDGPGHYYAVFSNQAALNQMLSLWDRWVRGQSLPDQYKEWDRVFACLQDLRRWGARDRVSLTHAERLRELATAILDGATVHIEIELVFRRGDAADNARTAIRRQLAAIGAREITAARHDGFAYDALLVEVSKAAALEIAERADRGIAGLGEAYRVRPQSVGQGEPSNDSAASTLRDVSQPRSEGAIAAIFDALPVQNHPLLAGRLNVSDPDDLERLAVGPRLHGTAMASLVIHGDLQSSDPAISRSVYFRPLMVDRDNVPGMSSEQTLSERLLVDDIVRAVRRMKVGENGAPAEAPNVAIVNISFGVPDLVFDGTMSPLARCMDWLAWEHGILFVVSAGNCNEPLRIGAFADEAAFLAANPTLRTENGLAALRDAKATQQLLSPAEGINVLTVGALHDDNVRAAHTTGSSYDPLPEGSLPSLTTRLGLGFNRSIKPDLLASGGRLRVHLRPMERPITYNRRIFPSRLGGLMVAGIIDPIGGAQDAWSGCTSGAAALTTHALHLIHDALEDAYGEQFTSLEARYRSLLLKALLMNRTRWPTADAERIERIFGAGEKRHATKVRADIARLYGFGLLDQDAARTCVFNRATGWGVGALSKDDGQVIRMPLPEALIGQRIPKALTATACWFTPILPGRQSYRAVKLRIDEKESFFKRALQVLGAKTSSDQHSSQQTWRGTILHRRYEGKSLAKFKNGDFFDVKISRMWDDQVDEVPEVPYAIAVSLEAEGEVPVFDQVIAKIDIGLRPRIPTRVVVGR